MNRIVVSPRGWKPGSKPGLSTTRRTTVGEIDTAGDFFDRFAKCLKSLGGRREVIGSRAGAVVCRLLLAVSAVSGFVPV